MATRREVMLAAPAFAIVPAMAQDAETETEISRLFAKWKAHYNEDAVVPSETTEELEALIAALPPTNLRDYALKVFVWTIDGSELNGCHMDDLMLAEMRKLSGVVGLFV